MGAIGAALFALFWYFWGDYIKDGFRLFRWGEMWLLSFILSKDYTIMWEGSPVGFHALLNIVPDLAPSQLDKHTLDLISYTTLYPLKWIFIIVLFLMSIWCFRNGPGTQFRQKKTMTNLIATQAKIFPVISPFVQFNPATQPPRPPGAPVPADLPAFAEALGPEEWLAYNQIPAPDGNLDEQALSVAFARQLGPRWKGALKLKPHRQILVAACCLKAARKRTESDDMLGRIAQCWSFEKGLQLGKDKKLLKDAQRVLKDKSLSGPTLAKANQHAFQTSALLRILATAREEGGVLAPAQFVWLRAFDRALWYPLNNLGRQAYHLEALGAMSHYVAEKRTQRPIPKPKLDDAIQSMVEYMSSDKARPIPQLDYSKSKRKGIKKPKSAGVKKPKKK